MIFSNQILGSSLLLPAHGRAGARVTPFLAAFFAKRKTKFGGGKALLRLSASDGQASAGKNSLPAGRQASPQPPFLPAPPERSVLVSAARSAAIIRDFAQKRFALRSVIATKIIKNDAPHTPRFLFLWSGCRESNPVYMHPMHAYYHYTTARMSIVWGIYVNRK